MADDIDVLKRDMRNMMQDTGDAIVGVFDQMLKGKWHDDLGHDVQMNAQMLKLKDVLVTMTEYRSKNPWTLERTAPAEHGEGGE
mgnify:CR=1 FL=1